MSTLTSLKHDWKNRLFRQNVQPRTKIEWIAHGLPLVASGGVATLISRPALETLIRECRFLPPPRCPEIVLSPAKGRTGTRDGEGGCVDLGVCFIARVSNRTG